VAELRSTRILISGATGFLGSHLIRRLLDHQADVHILRRSQEPAPRIADFERDVKTWYADVRDAAKLEDAVRAANPQFIFHLAGDTAGRVRRDSIEAIENSLATNLYGTLNLLKAARRAAPQLRRIIRTGGVEEYGNGPIPYDETQRESPVSPYSASQAAVTHICQMFVRTLAVPVVTIRPAFIYGPAQETGFFIPSLISHCLRGQDFEMTSGSQTREWLYVDDLIDAFVACIAAEPEAGLIINVGPGQDYQVLAAAHTIIRLTGARIQLKVGAAPERPSDIRRSLSSIVRAKELLNWTPKTDLETGLRQTIEWFRRHSAFGQPE
jgi:nucleoside-diphosphate-sugar epimerase